MSFCSFAGAFEQLGGCVGRYGRRTVLSLIAEVSSFAGAFVDDAMVGIYSPSAVAFNGGVQRDSFAVAFETPVVNGDQHGAVTGSQFVDGVCTGVHRCARGVQGCARGVHVECTWSARGVHVECTWGARGVQGCARGVQGCAHGMHVVCTGCARCVHGVCTWDARRVHVVCTECACAVHVVCTCAWWAMRTGARSCLSSWTARLLSSGCRERTRGATRRTVSSSRRMRRTGLEVLWNEESFGPGCRFGLWVGR